MIRKAPRRPSAVNKKTLPAKSATAERRVNGQQLPVLLTMKQAAEKSSMSRRTLYRHIARRKLRTIKLNGNQTRIKETELLRWLEAITTSNVPEKD